MKLIYSVLILLGICPSLIASDKPLGQQLEQARTEEHRQSDLASERSREIKTIHDKMQQELEEQAHNKAERTKIAQAHNDLNAKRKMNETLTHNILTDRNRTAQYAIDHRMLQRSVENEEAQLKIAQHDLERERRKKDRIKQQLETALHAIEVLQKDIEHEQQAFADLKVHTKKDYGTPALLQEHQHMCTQISAVNKQNAAVKENIHATQLNTKELEATNATLDYTNQKLKERLLAKLQAQPAAPAPVLEVIKIFKQATYKLGDENAFLAQHPGEENNYRVLAHAYLVVEQEYAASLNAALAIENARKGFAEKHTYKIASGIALAGFLAGICLRSFKH